ncbi:acyltransferase [Azospirillum sp. B506]|uniref:acyltransferase family protein n=1 Tax=Azospirillum sp. B506 TaxID=137721 RepID=UPI0005B29C8A|nr:acyltransferase [Azospirillum sp. B506]
MSTQTNPRHLHSLTPLRGIAALWVVLYHYSFQYFPNLHPDSYTHLVQKGYLAVDLFFMLSGFVLTHVYHGIFTDSVGDNGPSCGHASPGSIRCIWRSCCCSWPRRWRFARWNMPPPAASRRSR